MKHTLTSKAAELMRKNGRHRRWRRAFSGMAAVVVFITTYMLILPAITMENQAICGMAEHTHTDACYEMQLVCTQEETSEGADVHVHGPECYEQQQVLTCTKQEGEGHAHSDACYGYVCGQEESAGHTHTDACYTEVTHRELTCTEPESAGHTHGDGCYDEEGNLVCSESQSAGHTHSDSCYTETVTRELTCGQEESAGHTHTDACKGLICGQEEYEGHTHTDACYTTEDVLVCTQPTGHTHGDGCYEKVLVCDVPEHTHTEECYPAEQPEEPQEPQEPELICTIPEHSHEDACYDADGNLICGLEEHTHTEECYAPVEIPEEETPTTAFPEEIPEGYVEYPFDNENGLVVTAYAPEGAFDGKTVELVAEVLPEDSEEYAKAQENLDNAENAPEYDGMVAMDIRFVDADGNEVEPDASMGQVFVKIDAQALIPEDVDESTLAVQHHVETESDKIFGVIPDFIHPETVTVETVADSSEETGDITATPGETALPETLPALADEPETEEAATLEEPAAEAEETQPVAMNVEAEFAVNSFSTFTITWDNDSRSVEVYYVDTDGNEIDGTQLRDEDFGNRKWVDLNDYAGDILGYRFVEYKYGSKFSSSSHMADANQNPQIRYYYGGYYYRTTNSGDGDRIFQNPYSRNIYLVYEPEEVAPPISATVTTGKTVTLQNGEQPGGLYDLTLSVSGDRGSVENPAKVDILLVVDKSGSMAYDLDEENGNDRERMKAVVSAVAGLTKALESNNKVDVQYNLITFSSLDYTGSDQDTGWTTDDSKINEAVSYFTKTDWFGSYKHTLAGGTNYQYAFSKAKTELNDFSVRSDATQIVIFLTDGIPTHKGLSYESQDNDNSNFTNTTAAVNELAGLDADRFYCIGIGSVFSTNPDENDPENGRTNLQRIIQGVKALGITTTDEPYTTSSSSALEEFFQQIAGSTTFFAADNVTMIDPLSDYVDAVPDADGNYQFTVKVARDEGADVTQTVTIPEGQSSAVFSLDGIEGQFTLKYESKTITLDFPDNYQMEEGYVYSVTTTIQPTAAATDAGTARYNGRGDAGTGTHAGQSGFWSNNNNSAKVTYTSVVTGEGGSSEDGEELFPKPVIQVFDPGDIQMKEPAITKKANLREDGDYDLTLTVSGSTGTATKKAEVDVLMIVDVSNSMKGTKLNNAKSAITALVNTLENKETVDARYNVITFAQSAYEVTNGWVSGDSDKLLSFEDKYEGTNYQAGLRLGVEQLASARPTASTVVVFLSDGEPSHYLNANGTVGGTGSSAIGTNSTGWSNTLTEAKTVNSNKFYAVAIAANENHKIYMQELRDAINEVNPGSAEYIESDSQGNNLATKFEDIAGSVTAVNCVNVTISDTLSDYAEAVMGTNGVPEELTVKVTDANGNDVTETEVTEGNIIASYDAETKLLKLDFNDSYQLKQDYTYSVTLKIKPTKQAEDKYKELGGVYPSIPDDNTGTHSEVTPKENGFYSNKTATLTYKITGDNQTKTLEYPDPVIQLTMGSLKITKTVTRTDGGQVDPNSTFDFTVTVEGLSGSYDATYTNKVPDGPTHNAADGKTQVVFQNGIAQVSLYHDETVVISGLPGGKSATITETTTDGYSTNWTGDIASGTEVSPGATVTTSAFLNKPEVTCTNTTGAVLPSTGGMGTTPFLALGTLLTLGAGMLLVQRRRKEGSDAV